MTERLWEERFAQLTLRVKGLETMVETIQGELLQARLARRIAEGLSASLAAVLAGLLACGRPSTRQGTGPKDDGFPSFN